MALASSACLLVAVLCARPLGISASSSLASQRLDAPFPIGELEALGDSPGWNQVKGAKGTVVFLVQPECSACSSSIDMEVILAKRLAEHGLGHVLVWVTEPEVSVSSAGGQYRLRPSSLPGELTRRYPALVLVDNDTRMRLAVYAVVTPDTIAKIEELIVAGSTIGVSEGT